MCKEQAVQQTQIPLHCFVVRERKPNSINTRRLLTAIDSFYMDLYFPPGTFAVPPAEAGTPRKGFQTILQKERALV
jgi:hypothetical protein